MTWKQWPTLALAAGVLLVWACALAERDAWGLWRYVLLAGGALALAGAWGLRRLGAMPNEVTAALEQLAQDMQRVKHPLTVDVLGQAGNAWLLAGLPERANAVLASALAMDKAKAAGPFTAAIPKPNLARVKI